MSPDRRGRSTDPTSTSGDLIQWNENVWTPSVPGVRKVKTDLSRSGNQRFCRGIRQGLFASLCPFITTDISSGPSLDGLLSSHRVGSSDVSNSRTFRRPYPTVGTLSTSSVLFLCRLTSVRPGRGFRDTTRLLVRHVRLGTWWSSSSMTPEVPPTRGPVRELVVLTSRESS